MIDFIPLDIYTPLFNYLVLLLMLIAIVQANAGIIFAPSVVSFNKNFGYLVLIVLVFYMGLRPVSGVYFGDTANYAESYAGTQANGGVYDFFSDGEWVFNSIMKFFAWNDFSVHDWFLFLSFLYFLFNFLACNKIFNGNYYIPMLLVMAMFGFWTYGVNGIRVGLAMSMILMAIAYHRTIIVSIILCVLAFYIHKSTALVTFSAVLAYYIKNPKFYFFTWIATIGLSLVLGNAASALMLSIGFADERMESYLTGMNDVSEQFSSTGFRFDFLAYSALPMVYAYYFIFKRNFHDRFYFWLLGIYVFSNCFWIMVIRAAFSNRFAMLSWTIMPILLIYPFMQQLSNRDVKVRLPIMLCAAYALSFYSFIIWPIIS